MKQTACLRVSGRARRAALRSRLDSSALVLLIVVGGAPGGGCDVESDPSEGPGEGTCGALVLEAEGVDADPEHAGPCTTHSDCGFDPGPSYCQFDSAEYAYAVIEEQEIRLARESAWADVCDEGCSGVADSFFPALPVLMAAVGSPTSGSLAPPCS